MIVPKKWGIVLSVLGLVGFTVPHATIPHSGKSTVVGTFPSPPMGGGPGKLALWQNGSSSGSVIPFGTSGTTSGNSFFVGYNPRNQEIYIPTAGGTTYLVNRATHKMVGSFPSLAGGRIAKVVPNKHIVLILSGTTVAAYQANAPYKELYQLPVGGNALVVSANGSTAYIGGNMRANIQAISLVKGTMGVSYPVAQSGDMVWAHGQVFSADIQTGVMTALNPRTGKIVAMDTPEVDPSFSYQDIPAATAGFMQLAVSPHQHTVYAAGFSGHILKFSAVHDKYLGEVAVNVRTSQPNRLSGLAILPGGQKALVTAENLNTTAEVTLANGHVSTKLTGIASNRWLVIHH